MTATSWMNCLFVGYSHHTAPFNNSLQQGKSDDRILLRLQTKGIGRVELGRKSYIVKPGDLIIRKPGEHYRLVIDRENHAEPPIGSGDYYLCCTGTWAQEWSGRMPSKARIETAEGLLPLWRKLIHEKRNIHEEHGEMVDAIIKVLLLTVEKSVQKEMAAASRPELYIPYKMKQFMEINATKPLTLPLIAKRYGVSVSTASHLFKKAFGKSPMRYILDIRLFMAMERIVYSDMLLEDIAEACGFRSYSYFSRAFRAHYQESPSESRSQNRRQQLENM